VNGHQKGEFRNTLLLLYFLKKIELNQGKGKYFHIPTLFLKKIFLARKNTPQPTVDHTLNSVNECNTFYSLKQLFVKNLPLIPFQTGRTCLNYKTHVYSNLEIPGYFLFCKLNMQPETALCPAFQ